MYVFPTYKYLICIRNCTNKICWYINYYIITYYDFEQYTPCEMVFICKYASLRLAHVNERVRNACAALVYYMLCMHYVKCHMYCIVVYTTPQRTFNNNTYMYSQIFKCSTLYYVCIVVVVYIFDACVCACVCLRRFFRRTIGTNKKIGRKMIKLSICKCMEWWLSSTKFVTHVRLLNICMVYISALNDSHFEQMNTFLV